MAMPRLKATTTARASPTLVDLFSADKDGENRFLKSKERLAVSVYYMC